MESVDRLKTPSQVAESSTSLVGFSTTPKNSPVESVEHLKQAALKQSTIVPATRTPKADVIDLALSPIKNVHHGRVVNLLLLHPKW